MQWITRIACVVPVLLACSSANSVSAPAEGEAGAASSEAAPLYMKLTDQDVQLADETVQLALESNPSDTPTSWHNRKTGNHGTVTPVRTYQSKAGYFCREYRESVTVEARTERYKDIACRNGAGTWIPLVAP